MSDAIRVRACLAVVQEARILLVPSYDTDAGPIQWVIPGGQVDFGEPLRQAALREFAEETGLQAVIVGLLDVSEVVLPARPWHSITITFSGTIVGGSIRPEIHPRYGVKVPRWFGWEELGGIAYHPKGTVDKALACARQDHPSKRAGKQ